MPSLIGVNDLLYPTHDYLNLGTDIWSSRSTLEKYVKHAGFGQNLKILCHASLVQKDDAIKCGLKDNL